MILGKQKLREAVHSGEIKILDDQGNVDPLWARLVGADFCLPSDLDPVSLQPASIDLHLGDEWRIPVSNSQEWFQGTWGVICDSHLPVEYEETKSPEVVVPAHGFLLARTREVIGLPDNLAAKIDGRSSFGRLGVFVQNAGFIDPGFRGSVTLELWNALPHPVKLYAGDRVCQIVVTRVEGSTEGGYKGRYQGQIAATGTKFHETAGT